jgi:hypothetical protein
MIIRSRRRILWALASTVAAVMLILAVAATRADADEPASATPPVPSAKVKIVFKVVPPTNATVTWGKKRLGLIKPRAPLIIERPRDSGPLDVVVRADGCLPVHTRAYTFTDSTVAVKVTPPDKKNTLFGFREAPPDEDGGAGGPDAGMP